MKILIIDNNIDPKCWGAADLVEYASLKPNASIYVRRAPERDLPRSLESFDKIMISGSRTRITDQADWIKELEDCVATLLAKKKPTFGVCYGHQIIAKVLGGKTGPAEKSEFGWTRIELLTESPLTQGLPRSFYSFSAHYDEVSNTSGAIEILARSPGCPVQAFQVPGKPCFGIQFHPEKTLTGAAETHLEQQQKGEAATFMHAKDGKKFYDPKVAQTLFGNFLNL